MKGLGVVEGVSLPRRGHPLRVHAARKALGNWLRFAWTPGQAHDLRQAAVLLEGYEPEAVIADKG